MAPATSRHIEIDGQTLHVLEWQRPQSAATILCIHGGCANAHWWCHSAALLHSRYRVVAVDLRGHGESARLADGNYTLDGHRDDIVRLVDALAIDRLVLVGHSFGGFVSTAALPLLADRLTALVLVDTRGHIRKRAARYLHVLTRFPHSTYASRAEAIANFQLLPRETAAAAEVIEHAARHSIRQTEAGTWTLAFDRRALGAAVERNFDRELGAVRVPALVVRGELSTALSSTAAARLAKEIPGATTAEIADAHHHVMLDRPRPFAESILAFLDENGISA